MSYFRSYFTILALVLGGAFAQADVQSPVYQCALTFKAAGGGLQFVVGSFKLQGRGNLRCVDARGNTEVKPVKVTLGGSTPAARVAAGYLEVYGAASGLGYVTSPEALYGKYASVGVQGAFAGGAGASFAMRAATNNVTLNVTVQAARGLGLSLGFSNLKVEPLQK